ncbi:MAG TPA: IS1595 family transposase [Hyphomonadaceae bacterium]|nr:IS1595 family transposase [Hyphomonadaceae bacterium]
MAQSVLSEAHFQTEDAALAYIETRLWPNGPTCPFCGATAEHIGELNGKTTRAGLRKCYACDKPFTVRIGTIFEASHLPLNLWLQVIHLMCASKKGISTRQIQRMLQCSMKTAWHLTHRIREAMASGGLEPLGGQGKTIEADTTYVGGKEKNKHVGKRNPANIGGKGKVIVHAIVERNGAVRAHVIPNVNGATVRAILEQHASSQSALMTDTAGGYLRIGEEFASHEMVDHGKEEYVRGDAHTNTVEGYFATLKRGLTGVYHSVSEAHLHRYLAEFDFRHSNREKLGVNDVNRADLALQGVKGKRLTYRTTRRERRPEAS